MTERTKVLIPGASRGIGRATAILAGQRGWIVGVDYVHNAEATTDAVNDASGVTMPIQAAVENEQDVVRIFERIEQAHGKINAVVINAGITKPAMFIIDIDVTRLREVFEVNVLGAYLCAREAARRAPNEYVDYAGSKGAIDTLTVGIAKELGPEGIRVNAVRPGLINTEIHASSGDPGRADRLGKATPLGRAGEAARLPKRSSGSFRPLLRM